MARKLAEPKIVLPEDIDPRHNWDRPITALGHMAVDFEERVDFRRLHDYRLARDARGAGEVRPRGAALLRSA